MSIEQGTYSTEAIGASLLLLPEQGPSSSRYKKNGGSCYGKRLCLLYSIYANRDRKERKKEGSVHAIMT